MEIAAPGVGQPHEKIKPPIAFLNLPGLPSADRGRDDILHVGDAQAVAAERFAIRLDAQQRQALNFFRLDVGRAGDRFERLDDLADGLFQDREIVAVDLDRHVAAHPADQFIEAHLDRLGVGVVRAGGGLDAASSLAMS